MPDSPTQELRHEHDLVLLVLAAMEREVAALEGGGVLDADRIAQMVDFTRNFTDGCHHAKEERVLFPLLERQGGKAAGLVTILLSEHEGGRLAMRAIDEALPRAGDDQEARRIVAKNLADYAQVLRFHIDKEHDLLFPLADELLSGEEQRRVAAEFARIEEEETGAGVHERYHELAHALAAPGAD